LAALLGMTASLYVVAGCTSAARGPTTAGVYQVQERFVDAHGVLIYTKTLGVGDPLVIVHGGPSASHDYLMPWLLPLGRHNRRGFIDERGGRVPRVTARPACAFRVTLREIAWSPPVLPRE
jgi:pimeloyl-ACP methyl ester carboxylesterase